MSGAFNPSSAPSNYSPLRPCDPKRRWAEARLMRLIFLPSPFTPNPSFIAGIVIPRADTARRQPSDISNTETSNRFHTFSARHTPFVGFASHDPRIDLPPDAARGAVLRRINRAGNQGTEEPDSRRTGLRKGSGGNLYMPRKKKARYVRRYPEPHRHGGRRARGGRSRAPRGAVSGGHGKPP